MIGMAVAAAIIKAAHCDIYHYQHRRIPISSSSSSSSSSSTTTPTLYAGPVFGGGQATACGTCALLVEILHDLNNISVPNKSRNHYAEVWLLCRLVPQSIGRVVEIRQQAEGIEEAPAHFAGLVVKERKCNT